MANAWKVPCLWPDSVVYIIGGGPSLLREDLSPLHSPTRRVIGINNAYQLGPWVDILWFGDRSWFMHHRFGLLDFAGIKASCCSRFGARNTRWPMIKYVRKNKEKPFGITNSPKRDRISWNRNSGFSAINLAYYLGARRVVLLGFDMKRGEKGATHWHEGHKWGVKRSAGRRRRRSDEPYRRFLSNAPQIAKDAEMLGLKIVNCCLDSAITDFEKAPFKDCL